MGGSAVSVDKSRGTGVLQATQLDKGNLSSLGIDPKRVKLAKGEEWIPSVICWPWVVGISGATRTFYLLTFQFLYS